MQELIKDFGYVLVCSANTNDVHMLRGLLSGNHYSVQSCTGFYALQAQIQRQIPRILVFDDSMTLDDIAELCRMRDSEPYLHIMQIIGIVPIMNVEYERSLWKCGIDSVIYSPMSSDQIVNRVNASFERSVFLEERDGFEKLLFSLTSAYYAREHSSAGHPERVADNARRLGKRLGMSEAEQTVLYKGGMLHDIGMIKIPRDIIYKKGALDINEYEIVKTHTIWGDRLCRPLRALDKVLPLVRCHHERMNGSGYPDGLRGEEIPEGARIMGICEVYDALVS